MESQERRLACALVVEVEVLLFVHRPSQHVAHKEELDLDDPNALYKNLPGDMHDHKSPATQQENVSQPSNYISLEAQIAQKASRRLAILSTRRISTAIEVPNISTLRLQTVGR
jgi:hypothetical protein